MLSPHAREDRPGDPGFGVYIHWPFCAQKCPYCDFNSHVRFKGWDEARFLASYKRELDHVAERIGPRRVDSVFFGGGTPSLMQPETTAAIIAHIGHLWTIAPDAEITLEANPGSVEAGRFRGYRDAGVNRVSIGLQSLRDDELKRLGRIHSVAEAKAAVEIARATFERFSFDLIYARPNETPQSWRSELAEALTIAGDHLSLYQLTVEPDTPFAALHRAGKLIVPEADEALALYEITQAMTDAHGLAAYEISNHARSGQESRHNLLYWRYGEYAGVGPGAHGRIVVEGKRIATETERNPEEWCARAEASGSGIVAETALTPEEQADEMLLMGLRLAEGIDVSRLAALGGVTIPEPTIAELIDLDLIEWRRPHVAPAPGPGYGRNNELDPILMCTGPGLAPGVSPEPAAMRLRVTPRGRFVLNAIVAKLAGSFRRIGHMDNAGGAF